jgi:hypothetical protein
MAISKSEFSALIKSFNFRELFNIMGWNNDKSSHTISVDNHNYPIQSVAEKSGFKIIVCNPGPYAIIPDYTMRKKIENQVTRLFQEHLIIFTDHKKQEQIWQFVVRQSGKPTKVTETRYHISQDPELLYQRASGIFFEMEEEGNITIVDVTRRMADNFHANADKITKQFYDNFKKEHSSFLNFIKGINEQVNKDWYASLMLNRLMFCYFIQKKGFLDNNKNYLREKLNACQVKKGKNKFYSFYRNFLLVLFHQGLNEIKQLEEVKIEIGKIPYLNGGLFDEHELEKLYKNIDIDDKAFERIFDFFDQYEWHLDTRISASGKDINPDVIGYIFEKYINDRAQMGAYYTKEDITEYISKNCIIPCLFDETKRQNPKAFKAEGFIWEILKKNPDSYIYDAVKKGTDIALPEEIEVGISNVAQRTEWNKPAQENFALPTEIWREVVDRRNRYNEVRGKIQSGEVYSITDLITYNLNIRQFAQDVIEDTDDPDFIRHFYKAISSVTILDPTCGSGAFLFAAMNILEPLYEACIMRMRAFVEDEDRLNEVEQKAFSHRYKDFRLKLEEIQNEHHPNLRYYIYKSIILQNLYGVDIMKEAVEIAKLRLFLKLVATVEVDFRKPNLGLEPLPDIDFNIRAGNTLVGFGTEAELNNGLTWTFDGQLAKPIIEEKCDIVAKTFKHYKEIQLNNGNDYADFKKAKDDLIKRLKELNHELNQLLHKQAIAIPYDKWLLSYQPFHWFAEFYDIMNEKGGFDVVIGNPPYVEYSAVRKIYTVNGYSTISSGNLYALICERVRKIISSHGYFSFIVPISVICTQRMEPIQKLCFNSNKVWMSNYGERPSKLFTGAEVLLTIFIIAPASKSPLMYSTGFTKWKSEERTLLFERTFYNTVSFKPKSYSIPKIGFNIENAILKKIKKGGGNLALNILKVSSYRIFYRIGGGRYWKIFTDFSPKFVLNGVEGISSRENYLFAKSENEKNAIISILSSSFFYWYFILTTNCRDLNPSDLKEFPISVTDLDAKTLGSLSKLCDNLMADYKEYSELKEKVSGKTGNIIYQEFYPRLSKTIIDEIDTVLAEHYGFTAEELDFIINYDIKYRMGKELENGDEE